MIVVIGYLPMDTFYTSQTKIWITAWDYADMRKEGNAKKLLSKKRCLAFL